MTDYQEQQACEANTDNTEQYLLDQLDKHITTDPLEDILKQLEKQIHTSHTYTQNEQLKTLKMEHIQVTCYIEA